MSKKPTKPDPNQGVDTTGHEWDGIEELNNPLPRWWLWTFYATVVWGLAYTVAYPAWPMITQATPGLLGYSSRAAVAADIDRFREANAPLDNRIVEMELVDVRADDDLNRYAVQGGAAVFRTYCSQCHGSGAAGVEAGGYPNLLDDDWLWGGTLDDIYFTVAHGIRYDPDPDTRFSQMPAYGEILEADEIAAVVEYVLKLSGQDHDATLAAAGAETFELECAACHGDNGEGIVELGAPNLSNNIWLYGGTREAILESVTYARYGIMPNWKDRLTEAQMRKVALYVHQLGGGQ